jgi:hypothetical protein
MDWRCPHCGVFTRETDFCAACGGDLSHRAKEQAASTDASRLNEPLELDDPGAPAPVQGEAPPGPATAPPPFVPESPAVRPKEANRALFDEADRVRRRSARWGALGTIFTTGGIVGLLYYVGNGVAGSHIKHHWEEDPSIPPGVVMLVTAPDADMNAVKGVCLAVVDLSKRAQAELHATPEIDRKKKAAEWFAKWESLDDARVVIANKSMPDATANVMAGCRDVSQQMGNYLSSFDSLTPPSVTDGTPLTAIGAQMTEIFMPRPPVLAPPKPPL